LNGGTPPDDRDPGCGEREPEVVAEAERVLQAEDEHVADDDDAVEVEEDLGSILRITFGRNLQIKLKKSKNTSKNGCLCNLVLFKYKIQ
jgi:hypothetical protein